ncbi:MAG: TolC family protein [Bdellovibrionota bacterium]
MKRALFPIVSALLIGGSGCAPSLSETRSAVEASVAHRLGIAPTTFVAPDSGENDCWLRSVVRDKLEIDTAVAISLLYSPSLQALYGELGISRADLIEAGLPKNPVFSMERRFRGQALEIDVAQDFLSVFLIPLRKRVAESALEATKFRVANELLSHAFAVKTAFYSLQSALQMQELRSSVREASDASVEIAERMGRAGNISGLELAEQRSAGVAAKLALADSEQEVSDARERLIVLLGLPADLRDVQVSARLSDPPSETPDVRKLEEQAVERRLDLLAARAELQSVLQSVGVTYTESELNDLVVTSHYEREPEGRSTAGPSIEVPIPIFDWGGGARAKAEAMVVQAESKLKAKSLEIRSEVRSAFTKMDIAKRRAVYYRKEVLPLRQAVLDETQLRYNGMISGVFQLLTARESQIQAGQSYVEALRDYWLARTDLEAAVGAVLSASVEQRDVSAPDSSQASSGGESR